MSAPGSEYPTSTLVAPGKPPPQGPPPILTPPLFPAPAPPYVAPVQEASSRQPVSSHFAGAHQPGLAHAPEALPTIPFPGPPGPFAGEQASKQGEEAGGPSPEGEGEREGACSGVGSEPSVQREVGITPSSSSAEGEGQGQGALGFMAAATVLDPSRAAPTPDAQDPPKQVPAAMPEVRGKAAEGQQGQQGQGEGSEEARGELLSSTTVEPQMEHSAPAPQWGPQDQSRQLAGAPGHWQGGGPAQGVGSLPPTDGTHSRDHSPGRGPEGLSPGLLEPSMLQPPAPGMPLGSHAQTPPMPPPMAAKTRQHPQHQQHEQSPPAPAPQQQQQQQQKQQPQHPALQGPMLQPPSEANAMARMAPGVAAGVPLQRSHSIDAQQSSSSSTPGLPGAAAGVPGKSPMGAGPAAGAVPGGAPPLALHPPPPGLSLSQSQPPQLHQSQHQQPLPSHMGPQSQGLQQQVQPAQGAPPQVPGQHSLGQENGQPQGVMGPVKGEQPPHLHDTQQQLQATPSQQLQQRIQMHQLAPQGPQQQQLRPLPPQQQQQQQQPQAPMVGTTSVEGQSQQSAHGSFLHQPNYGPPYQQHQHQPQAPMHQPQQPPQMQQGQQHQYPHQMTPPPAPQHYHSALPSQQSMPPPPPPQHHHHQMPHPQQAQQYPPHPHAQPQPQQQPQHQQQQQYYPQTQHSHVHHHQQQHQHSHPQHQPVQQQQHAPPHMQHQQPPPPLAPQQQQPGPPEHQAPGQAPEEDGGVVVSLNGSQMMTLLDEMSLLDTQRVILEPGTYVGNPGVLLNLTAIRNKVHSVEGYSLPEMLVDLNTICEPFLTRGPEYAEYGKQFLDKSNEAIVRAVHEAQMALVAGDAPYGANAYVPSPQQPQQPGQPHSFAPGQQPQPMNGGPPMPPLPAVHHQSAVPPPHSEMQQGHGHSGSVVTHAGGPGPSAGQHHMGCSGQHGPGQPCQVQHHGAQAQGGAPPADNLGMPASSVSSSYYSNYVPGGGPSEGATARMGAASASWLDLIGEEGVGESGGAPLSIVRSSDVSGGISAPTLTNSAASGGVASHHIPGASSASVSHTYGTVVPSQGDMGPPPPQQHHHQPQQQQQHGGEMGPPPPQQLHQQQQQQPYYQPNSGPHTPVAAHNHTQAQQQQMVGPPQQLPQGPQQPGAYPSHRGAPQVHHNGPHFYPPAPQNQQQPYYSSQHGHYDQQPHMGAPGSQHPPHGHMQQYPQHPQHQHMQGPPQQPQLGPPKPTVYSHSPTVTEGDLKSPSGSSPGSGARSRVAGRRCEVCAVIKKAGCGTDAAHFRCLKRKRPENVPEIEEKLGRLGELGDEERVTVWNPAEGRKLSGQAAPMMKNLAGWLANHPGWEAHPKGAPPSSHPLKRYRENSVETLPIPPLLERYPMAHTPSYSEGGGGGLPGAGPPAGLVGTMVPYSSGSMTPM